ncbi:hypothetical protein ACFFRR_005860 [Megaselia abdita]
MKSLHFSYFAVSLLCLLIVTSSAVMSQETTTKPDLIERIENVLEGVMSDIRNVSKEIEEKVEQEIQVFHEKLDDAYQTVKLRIHNISHDVIDFLVEIEVKVDNSVYCVESLSEEIHATVANSERNLTTCIGIAYDCFKNVTTDIFNELDLVDRGYLDVKTLAEQCWGDKNNSLLLLDCIIMGVSITFNTELVSKLKSIQNKINKSN